ncbi:MAG: amino acid racemase [Amphiplicatus sp.]
MKTIGILGGCSAVATGLYYRRLNELAEQKRPGHGAKILIHSFDRGEIDAMIGVGDWTGATFAFVRAAQNLEKAGADAVLIATNSMHRIAGKVSASVKIPLIHIIDEAARALKSHGRRRALVVGTRYVMDDSFYVNRLAEKGVEGFPPPEQDRDLMHRIIYDELMYGRVTVESQDFLGRLADNAEGEGADSVILACTELGLLLNGRSYALPMFDTAELHVAAAHAFAFSAEGVPTAFGKS